METEQITPDLSGSETLNSIYTRRAVRKYRNKPVDHEIIQQLIDAGRMAPSAINKQPWRFYILTNKETIHLISKEISKALAKNMIRSGPVKILQTLKDIMHFHTGGGLFKSEDPIFHGAPVVIFISAPTENEWAALDIGMCAQNIMLAAKSLGLNTCPVGLAKFVEQTKSYPLLGIPSSDQVLLAVILGYGDEEPVVHKRLKNNAVFIE